MTQFTLDGFTFVLQEESNIIYVFKGNAFVEAHTYFDCESAKKDFEVAKTKKRVIFKTREVNVK